MEEFAQVISNLGFPVAVAVYLLWRMEKKLDNLEGQVSRMANMVKDNNKILEKCGGRRK